MNKELQDKLPVLPEGYHWVVKDNPMFRTYGGLFNPMKIQMVRTRLYIFQSVVQQRASGRTISSLVENAQILYREEFPPEDTLVGEYR